MQYAREFREHWRSWIGAALGLSVGAGTQAYSNNLFAPHMIAEFGWNRATFALQGTLSVFMFLVIPFVGRLTDLFGARRIATFGVITLPVAYLAFSLQNGSIALFFGLSIAKMIIGATTASLVYCRIVALKFTAARGLALAVCASAPALLMTVCAPVIGAIVDGYGWRVGYQALAGMALLVGLLAVLIIPPQHPVARATETGQGDEYQARKDYATIFRTRAFWIVFGAMFLCNAPNVIVTSQFGIMLVEQDIDLSTVPWLISLYGTSVVIGRFACGLALDHLPAYGVAAVSMAMPAIGLFLLGAELHIPAVIVVAIVFVGLAQGAEGDLVSYIVAHYFPKALYGSVAGLVGASLALASSLGAVALSVILYLTDSFQPFLQLMAVATLIGAALFLLLRSQRLAPSAKSAALA